MSLDSVQFSRRSLLLGTLAVCCGCRSVPLTERKQILFSSEESEASLGLAAYQQVLKDQPASTNAHFVEMVERVGQRIAKNSGRTDYEWEFQTLAGSEQNAFCLPGGKVAVYEGMMPVCHTEAGLAVVMSHEIGHGAEIQIAQTDATPKALSAGKSPIQSAGFSVDRESSVDAHQAIPWSPSSRQTLR